MNNYAVCEYCLMGYHEDCDGIAYNPRLDRVDLCGCEEGECGWENTQTQSDN